MSAIYYVDIVLLIILYLLIMFMCGYSVFCVYRLLQSMQMRIMLKPTRVVFPHKKEGESTEELRTVVAYKNPFTGDYCVHKSHDAQSQQSSQSAQLQLAQSQARGFINPLHSPDSGWSDEYEPLRPQPPITDPVGPKIHSTEKNIVSDNSVNKTWNWNYKEYQI